jgi:hypothetical protein
MVINMVEQRLARDGLLDDKEVDYILNLKLKHGLLTQETIDNYHAMVKAADEYAGAINRIPADKTVRINTIYTSAGAQGYVPATGSTMNKRASGGPVKAGQAYLVGEEGPELLVPKGDGEILPNGDLTPVHSLRSFQGQAPGPFPGREGGIGGSVVNHIDVKLVYNPTFSIGDRLEMEMKVMPLLRNMLSKMGVRTQ